MNFDKDGKVLDDAVVRGAIAFAVEQRMGKRGARNRREAV
jgi:hypothetical protein